MKFSIVVPSYNQGEFLERTLLSIINQDYENVEIIVIDGGSTDNSVEIVKKYEDKIAYWVSERDRGQSHALNKGFAKATGDIFGWLNSDDVYMPGAFSHVVKKFEEYPDKKVVYGNWCELDEEDNKLDHTYSAPAPRVPHFPYEGFDANLQSMFWYRSVYEQFGKFDESLHRVMDSDFLFSVIFNQGADVFLKTDKLLGGFRRYIGQKTELDRVDDRLKFEENVLIQKYNFVAPGSIAFKYRVINYFLWKASYSIRQGGFLYTWRKFMKGYKKRTG